MKFVSAQKTKEEEKKIPTLDILTPIYVICSE